eukprot:9897797-Lingulodinium_polyedra.AAC.1
MAIAWRYNRNPTAIRWQIQLRCNGNPIAIQMASRLQSDCIPTAMQCQAHQVPDSESNGKSIG